jgi:hypothetical protein
VTRSVPFGSVGSPPGSIEMLFRACGLQPSVFQLFTKGIVMLVIEVVGEFGEHFLAAPLAHV